MRVIQPGRLVFHGFPLNECVGRPSGSGIEDIEEVKHTN